MSENQVKNLRDHFRNSFLFGERSQNRSSRRFPSTANSHRFNRSRFGFTSSLDIKHKYERDPKQLRVLICTSNLGNAEPSKESMAAWIPEKGDMDSVIKESQFDISFETEDDENGLGRSDADGYRRYGHFDIIVIGMQEATFSCDNSNRNLDREDDAAINNGAVGSKVRRQSEISTFDEDIYFNDSVDDQDLDGLCISMEEKKEQTEILIKETMEELKDESMKQLDEEPIEHKEGYEKNFDINDQESEVKVSQDNAEGLGEERINELKIRDHYLPKDKQIMLSEKSVSFSGELDEMIPDNLVSQIIEDEPEKQIKTNKKGNIFPGSFFRSSLRSSILKKKQAIPTDMKKPIDVSFVDITEKKKTSSESKLEHVKEHFVSSKWDKRSLMKSSSVRRLMHRSTSSVSSLFTNVRLAVRSSTGSENCVRMKGGRYENNSRFKKRDTLVLLELISERCPNHDFVVNYLHGAIRLVLLVKKKLVKELQDVNCKAVSTGIASVLRNKGGIVASMTIRNTRLAFISAHLAAHEGSQYYHQRNHNIASILNGGKLGKYDPSLANHHCFLLGDLNYRLKYPPEYDEKLHATKKAVEMVKERNWHVLNDMDELHEGLRQKEVLVGFKTPLCLFPPTFKVERARGYHYLSQRSPSYTDRILWKSSHGLDSFVTPLVYESIENYTNSDHKPIRCAFHINTHSEQITIFSRLSRLSEIKSVFRLCRKSSASQRKSRASSTRSSFFGSITGSNQIEQLCIDVSGIKFYPSDKSNILWSSSKKKSTSSYYVMFDSLPAILESRKPSNSKYSFVSSISKPHSTRCLTKKSACVVWDEEKVELRLNDDFCLDGAILYINIMSKMIRRENDLLIGTVALNLETMCKFSRKSFNGRNFVVDEPLLKNGQMQGSLTCNIKVFNGFLDLL